MKLVLISSILVLISACVHNSSVPSPSGADRGIDRVITLIGPKERAISVRYLEPKDCAACPLIVFSHGANAAYDRYDRYLLPLSALGYRIAAANHVDSEEHPQRESFERQEYLSKRMEDMQVIIEHFQAPNLIVAGHSFGALVAQISGGAQTQHQNADWQINYQANAVLALSPPGPIEGYFDASTWSTVTPAHLVVTGTNDLVPGMVTDWRRHLVSYQADQDGVVMALVYTDIDHYFNGAYGREKPELDQHAVDAMAHLVQSSDLFLRQVLTAPATETPEFSQRWLEQSNDLVEAMSK